MAALFVGVSVSLLQTITQIQEMTLTFRAQAGSDGAHRHLLGAVDDSHPYHLGYQALVDDPDDRGIAAWRLDFVVNADWVAGMLLASIRVAGLRRRLTDLQADSEAGSHRL